MASFVKTTTLVRTAILNANGTVTQVVPPTVVASWTRYVASVDEAIALLPAAAQPAPEQRGGYDLRYDPRAYFTLQVVGVVPNTDILVVHLTVWQRFQDRNLAPVLRDSLAMQINGPLRDMESAIRAQLDAMLVRHTQTDASGDIRDLLMPVTTDAALDPAGLLQRADVQRINGAAVRYD